MDEIKELKQKIKTQTTLYNINLEQYKNTYPLYMLNPDSVQYRAIYDKSLAGLNTVQNNVNNIIEDTNKNIDNHNIVLDIKNTEIKTLQKKEKEMKKRMAALKSTGNSAEVMLTDKDRMYNKNKLDIWIKLISIGGMIYLII